MTPTTEYVKLVLLNYSGLTPQCRDFHCLRCLGSTRSHQRFSATITSCLSKLVNIIALASPLQ